MTEGEEVTFGVPLHRGAELVAETLESIREQTHGDLRVLISVDGPDPASEAACRPFLEDPRFRMVVQPRSRGWAQNISWLMRQVRTPFWCNQHPGDLLDPRYLATLMEHARRTSRTSIVYCDVDLVAPRDGPLTQSSLTGKPVARQLTQLVGVHRPLAFQGLTSRKLLRRVGGVPANEGGHVLGESVWVSAASRYGEHYRVPVSLYRRRSHEGVHPAWPEWPAGRRARAWIVHCVDMLEQAMALDAEQGDRRLLWAAIAGRVVSDRALSGLLAETSRALGGREALLESFLRYVREERTLDLPRLLGARWGRIIRWAHELSLRP